MPEPAVTTAYRSALEVIAAAEPDVANAIVGELESQRHQLKLIASETGAHCCVGGPPLGLRHDRQLMLASVGDR